MAPVPWVCPGKEHIPVYQDESIFHVNEYRRRVWIKSGQQPLRKKGHGRSIHVSDFITEKGRLVLTEEEEKENNKRVAREKTKSDARVITYPGKGHDAWWDGAQLVNQVRI
jgi:hypothetical protein